MFVCVLHVPHPSSHGAQLGSHFAALLWPSRPCQPYVTSPSPAGGAGGNPLRTQKTLLICTLGCFHCLKVTL